MQNETVLYKVIQTVALVFIGHLVMVVGIVLGLGLFLTLPALMTVFELYRMVQDRTDFARLKLLPFIWQKMRTYGKKYVLWSALWSLGLIAIPLNMAYFMTQWGNIGLAFTLLSILIWGNWLAIGTLFAYIKVNYSNYHDKELIKNAVSYSMTRYVEIFIGHVLMLGGLLLIEQLSLGLLMVTFLGIIGYSYVQLYGLLLSGVSINQLWQTWRRSE